MTALGSSNLAVSFSQNDVYNEDILDTTELKTSPDSSTSESLTEQLSKRKTTGKRRVIHFDNYHELFGNLGEIPIFGTMEIQRNVKQPTLSPEFKRVICGLSDEALAYFPHKRRIYKQPSPSIVKNLSCEFDELVEEEENSTGMNDKNYLNVPTLRRMDVSRNGLDLEMNDHESVPAVERSSVYEQRLRRKPTFKRRLDGTSKEDNPNNYNCLIS